eukprot:gene17323-7703_t
MGEFTMVHSIKKAVYSTPRFDALLAELDRVRKVCNFQDEPVQGNVPRGQCTASNTTFAKRRHVVVQRQKRSRLVLPAHVPVLQKTTNTTNTTTNNN